MGHRKSIIQQDIERSHDELADRAAARFLARAGWSNSSKDQGRKPVVFEGIICVQHANGSFPGRTLVFPDGATEGIELSRWLREQVNVSANSAPELADRVRITIERL